MFGKLTALFVVGFAALVSASSDFSVSEQIKYQIANGEKVYQEPSDVRNEAPQMLGAYPEGFLAASQLVKDSDK